MTKHKPVSVLHISVGISETSKFLALLPILLKSINEGAPPFYCSMHRLNPFILFITTEQWYAHISTAVYALNKFYPSSCPSHCFLENTWFYWPFMSAGQITPTESWSSARWGGVGASAFRQDITWFTCIMTSRYCCSREISFWAYFRLSLMLCVPWSVLGNIYINILHVPFDQECCSLLVRLSTL